MILPEVLALTPLALERVNQGLRRSAELRTVERDDHIAGLLSKRRTVMSYTPIRNRLRGLAAAVRFSWIPVLCAGVVAVASEDPRGRMLALWIAVASLCLGFAAHIREIVQGRPARRASPGTTWIGAEERIAGLG
jgi:hypothetical protein